MKNLKHLFLLLFLSFATVQGQTRSDIQVLIDNIATGVPNTALKIRTVLNAIANGSAQTGDVKEIDVSTAYIASNFDVTGLGTNQRLGWAICNGNNGTRNRGGRIGIGYDVSNYPTLGATGGSATVSLTKNNIPILDATFPMTSEDNSGGPYNYLEGAPNSPDGTKLFLNSVNQATTNTPVDVRQPYIVSLYIMKL